MSSVTDVVARIFRRRVVWLRSDALAHIRRDATCHDPVESGGVLLGYRTPSGVVVVAMIGGGPEAVRSRSRFVPDAEWQEAEIARRYTASGYRTTYLGDWHSHPHSHADPSDRDNNTAARIARTKEARCAEPTFVIVSRSGSDSWIPHGFLFRRGSLRASHVELFGAEAVND